MEAPSANNSNVESPAVNNQTSPQCQMDVGLLIDENIADVLLSPDNLLVKICQNIDPRPNGNRTSIAVIGRKPQIIVKFSDPSSTDIHQMTTKMKDYYANLTAVNTTTTNANDTQPHYPQSLEDLVRLMFSSEETHKNATKSLIFLVGKRTLQRFFIECANCNEWILQHKINFYIVETNDGENRNQQKPLKINWLSETNYYPLKSMDLVLTVLPIIFQFSCQNNFSSNSAIFKSESLYSPNSNITKGNNTRRSSLHQYSSFSPSGVEHKNLFFDDSDIVDHYSCPVKFQKMGCFNRRIRRHLTHPLVIRDCTGMLCKRTYSYMNNIVCLCAKNANDRRFKRFGINKYGFCFSSPSPLSETLLEKSTAADCHNTHSELCDLEDRLCYGGRDSIVMYRVIDS